jgi:hypothetical protein
VFRQASALSRSLLIQPSRSAGQRARQLAGIRHARRSLALSQKSWLARESNLAQWNIATATDKKLESRRTVAGGSPVGCRVRASRDFPFCI